MIKEVYYEEVPSDAMSLQKGGEYYYHLNLMKLNSQFMNDYMDYESHQLDLKNKILGNAIRRGDVKNIRPDRAVISLSSQKNKVVVIAEL